MQFAFFIGMWETIAILAIVLVLFAWRGAEQNLETLLPGRGKDLRDFLLFCLIAMVVVVALAIAIEAFRV